MDILKRIKFIKHVKIGILTQRYLILSLSAGCSLLEDNNHRRSHHTIKGKKKFGYFINLYILNLGLELRTLSKPQRSLLSCRVLV